MVQASDTATYLSTFYDKTDLIAKHSTYRAADYFTHVVRVVLSKNRINMAASDGVGVNHDQAHIMQQISL